MIDVGDTIYLVCNPGYAYLLQRSGMNSCASYHIRSSIYILQEADGQVTRAFLAPGGANCLTT